MKPKYPRVVFEGACDEYIDADPRRGLVRIRVVQKGKSLFCVEELTLDAMSESRWLELDQIDTSAPESHECFGRLLEAIARAPRCRPSHRR